MSDFEEKKVFEQIDDEALAEVTGGVAEAGAVKVKSITPYWIRVTASTLNCRYTPNGKIAKAYNRGHRLKVNGVTIDGKWYRLLINDPRGGTCDGYIFKQYTERC